MQREFFHEEQRIPEGWSRLLLTISVITTLSAGYALYWQIGRGIPWGSNPMKNEDLMIVSAAVVISCWVCFIILRIAKMTVIVSDTGIKLSFPPFSGKPAFIDRSHIDKYEVRIFKGWKEHGGFGIQKGTGKSGKAYLAGGNTGLQFYLSDGKKLLVGTHQPGSFKIAVGRMMKEQARD